MNKKDLVVLCYASNTCNVQVVPLNEEKQNVRVDMLKGLWYMIKIQGLYYRIGEEMRYCENGSQGGVVGVYNKTDVKHLNHMVHHSKEATSDIGSALGD